MSRLPSPATIPDAPGEMRDRLDAARKQLGVVPNAAVKGSGYTGAQVIEVVLQVALKTWANGNEAFATDIGFPVVEARRAA